MTNIGNSAAVDEAITKFDKELIDVSFAPMFNVTLLSLGGKSGCHLEVHEGQIRCLGLVHVDFLACTK